MEALNWLFGGKPAPTWIVDGVEQAVFVVLCAPVVILLLWLARKKGLL